MTKAVKKEPHVNGKEIVESVINELAAQETLAARRVARAKEVSELERYDDLKAAFNSASFKEVLAGLEALEERAGSTFRFSFDKNFSDYDATPSVIKLVIDTNAVALEEVGNSGLPYDKNLEIYVDKKGNTSVSEVRVNSGDAYGYPSAAYTVEGPASVEKILKTTAQKAYEQKLVR
jgi:hypothetical protein